MLRDYRLYNAGVNPNYCFGLSVFSIYDISGLDLHLVLRVADQGRWCNFRPLVSHTGEALTSIEHRPNMPRPNILYPKSFGGYS